MMLLSCFNIFVFVCVNFYVAYIEKISFDANLINVEKLII